jgi:pyridinium-3,5-biscarboxylic acid mononucleotide sulfurtransferase
MVGTPWTAMDANTALDKAQALETLLKACGHVAVAFSGGVDSSYLLAAAVDALGVEHVVALTADSPLLPRDELERARMVAAALGVRHQVVSFDELQIPEVAGNHPLRCYHCKKARFSALLDRVSGQDEQGLSDAVLVHGENRDDAQDYRPGSRAARELGVRAPLAEVGLTKAEIRWLSRQRGLPTADIPAEACLATRFPHDTPLTREGLERVERAEQVLSEMLSDMLGEVQLRVRDHGAVARIEVAAEAIPILVREDMRDRIVDRLHDLGYRYVTLDLHGYRMGAMNEQLESSTGSDGA